MNGIWNVDVKVMFNTSITGLNNLRIVGTKDDAAQQLRISAY